MAGPGWFQPQPLPWQAGGGQGLAPNPWTGQPNSGMDLPNMGPAPTWGVGPQPDQPAWPQALGGAPNWQGMPDGMQQGQPDDDPIAQILEVTSTTPPDQAPDFISFMRQQDPHDVGMALALFQQSFTDPQGALQWAFQLKQSRDAQRARLEQKQVEAQAKQEAIKEKANNDKERRAYIARMLRIGDLSKRSSKAGKMDDLAVQFGLPPEEWTDEHVIIAEKEIEEENKKTEGEGKADTLRKQVSGGLRNPDNAYLEWKTKYGDNDYLKQDLQEIHKQFSLAREQKRAFLALSMREKAARTAFLKKLTPEDKAAMEEVDRDLDLIDSQLKEIDDVRADYNKMINWALGAGVPLTEASAILEQKREELLTERSTKQTSRVGVAGGRDKPVELFPPGGQKVTLTEDEKKAFQTEWNSDPDPAAREFLKSWLKKQKPGINPDDYIPK